MKIAIITDSGSGLNAQEAKEQGIYFLPLQIINNGEEFKDGEDITTSEVYDMLHQGNMPTTSMPTMGAMENLFKTIKKDGYDCAIAVMITAGLSSTPHVLFAVAKEQEFPVHMIETYTTCNIQRYVTLCAKQLVDQGIECDEIVKRLEESLAFSNTLIIPDDLQHLKRGGRLTPIAAALGGLLKIKPILQLNRASVGKIDVSEKVRTMSKALQNAVNSFESDGINEEYTLTVLHTDAPEEGARLKELMETTFPKCDVYFGLIGAVISCHTGIGCLGIQYIKKVKGC